VAQDGELKSKMAPRIIAEMNVPRPSIESSSVRALFINICTNLNNLRLLSEGVLFE
jgi:hypothetical protein